MKSVLIVLLMGFVVTGCIASNEMLEETPVSASELTQDTIATLKPTNNYFQTKENPTRTPTLLETSWQKENNDITFTNLLHSFSEIVMINEDAVGGLKSVMCTIQRTVEIHGPILHHLRNSIRVLRIKHNVIFLVKLMGG